MTGTRIRYHVYVDGRVQGVFFRLYTERKALELNVNGWVRNLPDGRVEIEVEGTPAYVEQMLQWLQHGPSTAHVTECSSLLIPPTGERGFTILF